VRPRWLALACALFGSCAAVHGPDQPGPFADTWGEELLASGLAERPWPGADWHATRQEDWRITQDGAQCVNAKEGTAGRTLALLTQTVDGPIERPVHVSFEVRTSEPASEESALRPGSHFGLLFGVGGEGVNPMRSALVQQAPAADGGWLLSVNAEGQLRISSFHDELDRAGYWTLPGGVDFDALPVLAEGAKRVPLDTGGLHFDLAFVPTGSKDGVRSGRLEASAWPSGFALAVEGPEWGLVVDDFPEADFTGSLSLFSARGVEGSADGFSFADFAVEGATRHADRAWGPILAATYLVDRSEEGDSTLRLTAHLAALGADDTRPVRLWPEDEARPELWRLAGSAARSLDGSDLATFTLPGYEDREDGEPRRYKVELVGAGTSASAFFTGSIRSEPDPDEPWTLASLSCLKNQVGPIAWNASGLWFPHEQLVGRIAAADPDFLYFSGDQIYEGDLTGPNRLDVALSIADYQTKYRRFLWAFRELLRDRPSVMIPDDHDVFHGNLWGAGGVLAEKREGLSAQDSGGYRMPAAFVNVVHRSLVSNLPPSKVSPVIGQGITTYTTDFAWGGVDFCVLADRMWKDSPSVMVPAAEFRNGWIQNAEFDSVQTDNPAARLLGAEQERFLGDWAKADEPRTWTKVALSQSPFACLHSLPAGTKSDNAVGRQAPPLPGAYPDNDAPVADGDSNGWPQSARLRAVELLAEAGALHLCGDQHLGTAAWYGTDAWRTGTVEFTSPAMGNTWPRRWMPREAGERRPLDADGAPTTPRYTGDYIDGFGNKLTMLAVANPVENGREPVLQMNRAPGFGIVRFWPGEERIELEAWPTWDTDSQYPGWPLWLDARGRPASGGW